MFLDDTAFFCNALVGEGFGKEPLPFVIGKGIVIEKFQLPAEIFDQARFSSSVTQNFIWMFRFLFTIPLCLRFL